MIVGYLVVVLAFLGLALWALQELPKPETPSTTLLLLISWMFIAVGLLGFLTEQFVGDRRVDQANEGLRTLVGGDGNKLTSASLPTGALTEFAKAFSKVPTSGRAFIAAMFTLTLAAAIEITRLMNTA